MFSTSYLLSSRAIIALKFDRTPFLGVHIRLYQLDTRFGFTPKSLNFSMGASLLAVTKSIYYDIKNYADLGGAKVDK